MGVQLQPNPQSVLYLCPMDWDLYIVYYAIYIQLSVFYPLLLVPQFLYLCRNFLGLQDPNFDVLMEAIILFFIMQYVTGQCVCLIIQLQTHCTLEHKIPCTSDNFLIRFRYKIWVKLTNWSLFSIIIVQVSYAQPTPNQLS